MRNAIFKSVMFILNHTVLADNQKTSASLGSTNSYKSRPYSSLNQTKSSHSVSNYLINTKFVALLRKTKDLDSKSMKLYGANSIQPSISQQLFKPL